MIIRLLSDASGFEDTHGSGSVKGSTLEYFSIAAYCIPDEKYELHKKY